MAAHSTRRLGKLRSLPVDRLERGSLQPRRAIDGQELKRLAESIRAEGVIQPIYVRKKGHGKFEIVAGERRWHAAKIAGLKQIPTVVGRVSDATALAISLIENLHREDLNTIDQARAMQRLIDEFGMTQQEVGDRIGRSRAAVSNLIRLLELPETVREMVADGELDMGHARALLVLPSDERAGMARYVAQRKLSVRDVEAMVKRSSRRPARSAGGIRTELSPGVTRMPGTDTLPGHRVSIRQRDGGRYCVSFSFATRAELDKAIDELRAMADRLEPSLPIPISQDAR